MTTMPSIDLNVAALPVDAAAQGAASTPAEPSQATVSAFLSALASLPDGKCPEPESAPVPFPALLEETFAVAQGLAAAVEANGVALSRIGVDVPAESAPVVLEPTPVPVLLDGNAQAAHDLETAAAANDVVLSRIAARVGQMAGDVVSPSVATRIPEPSPLASSVPDSLPGSVPVPGPVLVPGSVPVSVPASAPAAVPAPVPVPELLDANGVAARDLVLAVESNDVVLSRIAVAIPLETAVAANVALAEELEAARPLEVPAAMARDVMKPMDDATHEVTGTEAELIAQAASFVVPQVVAQDVAPAASEVRVKAVDVSVVKATALPPEQMLVEAAGAVAETLLVTPGLLRGQGEVVIQLRPDVLDGTEVRVAVTGRELQVVFEPRTVDMSVLIENCRPQLMEQLVARIHAFNVAVQVRPNVSAGRGARVRDEESV